MNEPLQTGKIEIDALQTLTNDVISLELDLLSLRQEVADLRKLVLGVSPHIETDIGRVYIPTLTIGD